MIVLINKILLILHGYFFYNQGKQLKKPVLPNTKKTKLNYLFLI